MSRSKKRKDQNEAENMGHYMSMKIAKLQNQFDIEKSKQQGIFSGISIYVNGYTEPPAEKLKEIMMANGGTYHHYYSHGKTTHIIAANLANTKIKTVKNKLIVYPKWIVDSLRAVKLLDYRKYLLYTNVTSSQPSINTMCSTTKTSAVSAHKTCSTGANIFDIEDNITSTVIDDNCSLSNESTRIDHNDIIEKDDSYTNMDGFVKDELKPNSTKVEKNSLKKVQNINCNKNSVNTSNENFLSEFYANSRLHHISAMSTLFKDYVEKCQTEEKKLVGRDKFINWLESNNSAHSESHIESESVIMHIDMDCFFVSVGLRNRPDLRGIPVVVTHSKGIGARSQEGADRELEFRLYTEKNARRGTDPSKNSAYASTSGSGAKFQGVDAQGSMAEIACCSYEAREFGIKNGMLLGRALKLCPELKTIPYNFNAYKEVSFALYDLVTSFTTCVEAVSCDEMYVDLTEDINQLAANPVSLAEFFRQEILSSTGCCCSIGIGPNILLARLATKKAKPDGIYRVDQPPSDFVSELLLADLPGIGWSFRSKLQSHGAITCRDLQDWDLHKVQELVGKKMGQSLFNYCRGIDDRMVSCRNKRKSVSAEINYGIRFQNWSDAANFVSKLSTEVAERLNSCSMTASSLTLKVKIRSSNAPAESAKFMGHGACDNATKSLAMATPISDAEVISENVLTLLKTICSNPRDLRGIGIQLSKLNKAGGSKNSVKHYFIRGSTDANIPTKSDSVVTEKRVLDVNILNELPEILRREVIKEYKASGYEIPDFILPSISHNFDKSCLVSETAVVPDSYNDTRDILVGEAEQLNRYSQINESFLDALPDSIKVELKEQFATKEKLPLLHQVPVRRRGRPRGKRRKAIALSPKKNIVPVNSQYPDRCAFKRATCSDPREDRTRKPNLAGETDLSSIKELLVKWIESCDSPEEEDVDEISVYCDHLVLGRDLETLDLFLKFFRRKMKNYANDWTIALQRIINKVQVSMKNVYNCPLQIL